MDSIQWNQQEFETVVSDFTSRKSWMRPRFSEVIPVDAWSGCGIVKPPPEKGTAIPDRQSRVTHTRMYTMHLIYTEAGSWYKGPTLLQALEQIPIPVRVNAMSGPLRVAITLKKMLLEGESRFPTKVLRLSVCAMS